MSVGQLGGHDWSGQLLYRSVDRQRLVHVDDDEVVITGLCTRELRGIELRRALEEALESVEPGSPILLGKVTPETKSFSISGLVKKLCRKGSGPFAYHSLLTSSLSLVQVFDVLAMYSSICFRPASSRSLTASAVAREAIAAHERAKPRTRILTSQTQEALAVCEGNEEDGRISLPKRGLFLTPDEHHRDSINMSSADHKKIAVVLTGKKLN